MKIHRVQIANFRNFRDLDVYLGNHAVIVGENKVGKSNFLYALRLVLDPSLPDSARQLQEMDFWDEIQRPFPADQIIHISVDLSDFEDSAALMASLAEHLISPVPMIARLTYVFQLGTKPDANSSIISDYEFITYGGDRPENRFGYDLRKRIPLDILPALRDAESDLATVRRSPLQPLFSRAVEQIDRIVLSDIANAIHEATNRLAENPHISNLANQITARLNQMVGQGHGVDIALGLAPTSPERLLRAVRILIDGKGRGISEASLGTANLLFIVLKSLELQQLVEHQSRDHTFLCIEEPEAHLHPHVQRLAYGDFLRLRGHNANEHIETHTTQTILLTTHSPHIVSVAPLRSIVLLRRHATERYTEAMSTAQINFTTGDVEDLERYLNVTRGEILFARGIILVEGDAEVYIIPAFARLLGIDLDQRGITVCSVSGTNFAPYVKLISGDGLRIPFTIITDLDPDEADEEADYGTRRVLKILRQLIPEDEYNLLSEELRLVRARELGIFLNSYTLEVELFRSGSHLALCETLAELAPGNAARRRAQIWQNTSQLLDEDEHVKRFLKDITKIGKGRFAQRLISHITIEGCPIYIREAIEYVTNACP